MNARNQRSIHLAFLFILFAGLFSGEEKVFAGVVYGNGNLSDPTNNGGYGFGAHDGYAMPFTVGASTSTGQRTLTGAYILIENSTASPVSTTISIWDTASVNAGPQTSLGSGSLSIGTTGGNNIWQYIPFSSPVVLAQSGNYYFTVQAAAANSSTFDWHQPNANRAYSDLGSGSGYAVTTGATTFFTQSNNSSLWTDYSGGTSVSDSPQGFQLVPEPSTYALLASGLCAAAVAAGRRRVRNSPQHKPASETATLLGDMAAR